MGGGKAEVVGEMIKVERKKGKRKGKEEGKKS